jgi:hypothetical protein
VYREPNAQRFGDGPTEGVFTADGVQFALDSTETGSLYSRNASDFGLPENVFKRGNNYGIYSHVEAKAARYMRENGITSASLVINNKLCTGVFSCSKWLRTMISKNATLRVYFYIDGKYGSYEDFVGGE